MEESTTVLDVKGLQCPMPLLKAKKALNEIAPGSFLQVIATDPGSVKDFQVFSRQSGHELIEMHEDEGVFRYLLKKKFTS
ncbi:MAG: sulfurtransferase TusA family protein [Gammaproteobacteria bacterium]|nr:sulfurtransferase TusA family protein [Gammaproteobacteria bacterium]